jgi:hypothetical protein
MARRSSQSNPPVRAAEQALQDLQRLVRRPPIPGERSVLTLTLPDDLASSEARVLLFQRDDVDAADTAIAALLDDLRFEHLAAPRRKCGGSWPSAASTGLPIKSRRS